MAFEEKRAWIAGVVAVVSYVVYLAVVLVRARELPVTEIAYVGPLVAIIGAGIVVTIAVTWSSACWRPTKRGAPTSATARSTDSASTSASRSWPSAPSPRSILAMAEWDHFWIANVL